MDKARVADKLVVSIECDSEATRQWANDSLATIVEALGIVRAAGEEGGIPRQAMIEATAFAVGLQNSFKVKGARQ